MEPGYLWYSTKNVFSKANFNFSIIAKKYSLQYLSQIFPGIGSYDLFTTFCQFVNWYNYYNYLLINYPNLKKVYYTVYYSVGYLALNSVANKLNIETIDVQHGVQADNHFAYGRWNYLDAGLMRLLPLSFYVFSQKERDLLKRTFSDKCNVKIVGNLLFRDWKKKNVKEIKKNKVLFTLQNNIIPADSFIYGFLEYLNKNHEDLKIVLRIHPRHQYLKNDFNKILDEKKIIFNWDSNSEIYDTLKSTSLHITQYSSVVEDALNLKTPSFVIDNLGAEYFKVHIKNTNLVMLVLSIKDGIDEFNKLLI